MNRTILHIDFDSFFASCEQHFNPNLRGKPIGITAQNGRNAVIAASREAKKFGIKSPNTTWEAKRLCPEIQFVKADFERYLEITKKLLSISNTYSPIVELFSLDEVFIDVTDTLHLFRNSEPSPVIPAPSRSAFGRKAEIQAKTNWIPDQVGDDKQKAILNIVQGFKKKLIEEVGPTITVSVGASYNKLLAKLATGLNKPDGFAMIDRTNKQKIFHQIPLTQIMGIGERYKHRLNMIGISNFAELEAYPMHLLRAEFGKVASENLKKLAMGIDDTPVISHTEETEAKSVGRNYCLPENTYDKEKNLQTIYELCEEVAIKLRRLKMKARTIGLFLHGNEANGARQTIGHYTNLSEDLFEVCSRFFKKWDLEYVRQVSIWTGNLIEEQYVTMPLFESPKKEVMAALIDKINDRFGHHTIRKGYLTNAPQLHTKPNGFMADRAMREELRSV